MITLNAKNRSFVKPKIVDGGRKAKKLITQAGAICQRQETFLQAALTRAEAISSAALQNSLWWRMSARLIPCERADHQPDERRVTLLNNARARARPILIRTRAAISSATFFAIGGRAEFLAHVFAPRAQRRGRLTRVRRKDNYFTLCVQVCVGGGLTCV